MTDSKNEQKAPKNHTMKSLNKELQENNVVNAQRFEKIEESVQGLGEEVKGQLTEVLKVISAKNNPTSIRKDGVHVEDVYLREDFVDIEFKENEDIHAEVETVRPGLRSIDNAEFQEKADQMRFDNEMVKIMVMASSSTYPDHTFSVGARGMPPGHSVCRRRGYYQLMSSAEAKSVAWLSMLCKPYWNYRGWED